MLTSTRRAACVGLICAGTAIFSKAARACGGLQPGPVDTHVDGLWSAARLAGPSGRRLGFLFYSMGAARNDRSLAPRTRSETICTSQSPLCGVALRYVKIGLLPRELVDI